MVFQFFRTFHSRVGTLITSSKVLLVFDWTSFGTAALALMAIDSFFGYFSWECIKGAKNVKTMIEQNLRNDILNTHKRPNSGEWLQTIDKRTQKRVKCIF